MIAIVIDVFLLQKDVRIVVVVKHSLSRFQHGNALAVRSGSIKQKCRAGWAHYFENLRRGNVFDFIVAHWPRMLLSMSAFDVIECATANIGEIKSQFYFSRNLFTGLIIPSVSVPSMKISFRRQRLPTLGFVQLEVVTEIATQNLFDQRVKRKINESLIEKQDIFDHVPVGFSLLITIEVVPAQSAQL